ncbi:MAG: hypothetical protein [Microviridae sp.]|nr:MAG: hypothetical protein [Microviridae sp.]
MIYSIKARSKTRMQGRETYEGETLESKIARMLEDNDPITEISERIYGTREEGVIPSTNIRSDRWDAAVDAMDAANQSKIARREAKREKAEKGNTMGDQAKDGMEKEGMAKPE